MTFKLIKRSSSKPKHISYFRFSTHTPNRTSIIFTWVWIGWSRVKWKNWCTKGGKGEPQPFTYMNLWLVDEIHSTSVLLHTVCKTRSQGGKVNPDVGRNGKVFQNESAQDSPTGLSHIMTLVASTHEGTSSEEVEDEPSSTRLQPFSSPMAIL